MPLSLIIPASNEAHHIGPCLEGVLAQTGPAALQVIVAANGCTDDTADRARAFAPRIEARAGR